MDDGLLDFVLVKVMPRLKIPGFLSRYKAGRHMDMACCEAFRGTRMRVSSLSPVVCNIDGECFSAPGYSFPGAARRALLRAAEGVRLPGGLPLFPPVCKKIVKFEKFPVNPLDFSENPITIDLALEETEC